MTNLKELRDLCEERRKAADHGTANKLIIINAKLADAIPKLLDDLDNADKWDATHCQEIEKLKNQVQGMLGYMDPMAPMGMTAKDPVEAARRFMQLWQEAHKKLKYFQERVEKLEEIIKAAAETNGGPIDGDETVKENK